MIHLHKWKGLTPAGRENWVEPFRLGCRVKDFVDAPAHGGILRNSLPCELDDELNDYDHLDLVMYPEGASFILGSPFLTSLFISAAVSFAIRALMPTPERVKERGDERSPTHGFGRLQNIRAEGQPIPVIYGEHMTGGTIFNEFIEVHNGTGESTYFALVGLGHGPIEAIAGETVDTVGTAPLTSGDKTTPSKVFLQGNPLDAFHQTKVWVRLGSNEQGVVPGFEKTKVTYEVNVELTSEPVGVASGSDLIPALDYGVGGNLVYEAVWDDHGFAWDVTVEDVDGAEVIINFPGGLWAVLGTGAHTNSRWVLGIRYCKLDGVGDPILGSGTGGNAGDGWVRLPHEEFELDRQNAFQLSFPVAFFDPADFIQPVPGDAWYVSTWLGAAPGNYISTTNNVTPGRRPETWQSGFYGGTGAIAGDFTFECWFAWDDTAGAGGGGPFHAWNGDFDYVPMFEWATSQPTPAVQGPTNPSGAEDGVWCGFKSYTDGRWIPIFRVGKWNRLHEWPDVADFLIPTTDAADKKWNHICWSHHRIDSSSNVTRFWINGVFLGEFVQNIDIVVPDPTTAGSASSKMKFGWSRDIIDAAADGNSARGWWDEIVVHDAFFDSTDVALRWNGGEGQRHSDADPNVVVLYHIQGGLTDSTSYRNSGSAVGSSVIAVGGGKITKFTAPSRTRGRYRIQCVRVNGESSPGDLQRTDNAEWQLSVTWIEQAFSFPGIAYTAIEVEATEQLNTSAPTVTQIAKGRLVKVWDGVSSISPSFIEKWTENTAWIAMDVATDEEYGGGQAFKLENTDIASVALLADRCDKRVYDGRGQRHFYRQEYEASGNKCTSPVSIDAFWNLLLGAPTLTLNTAEAPNGEYEADTLGDTDGAAVEGQGFTAANFSTEPDWYSANFFVKKDTTVTGHTCGMRITGTAFAAPIEVAFNIDTGEAVFGCSVKDYDDDWWWVRAFGFYYDGSGTVICYYLPAAYTRSTNTPNVALTGEMTVWGFSLARGNKNYTAYPGSEGPRAYLYMANEDAVGAAQTLPSHWVAGYELRIRSASETTWDTAAALPLNLEIVEVFTSDVFDGYDRVWTFVTKWPTEQAAPTGTFPNLVVAGENWLSPSSNWTAGTGVTFTVQFDDGGVSGGPVDADPKLSFLLKVLGAIPLQDPIEQSLPATVGPAVDNNQLTARAHIYKPSAGTDPQLTIDAGGGNVQTTSPASVGWNKVETVLEAPDTTVTIGIRMGVADSDFWIDGLSCWISRDVDGAVPGGTVEGAEALFAYDAVHDTFKGLWDTLVDVLLTARAMPIREGNKLRFKFEEPRNPVGLVTMGSIVNKEGKSTFRSTYVNDKVRPNSIVIDFHDRQKQWERSPASVDDPALEETSDAGLVRRENYFLLGVTRRSQTLRHALFNLAVNRTIIREGSFVCDPSAITFEPGDVIAIGHDLEPWGQGGRIIRTTGSGDNEAVNGESFDLWTPLVTGDYSVTSDSMSTPSGLPTADLIETLVDAQTYLEEVKSSIANGTSYTFSFRAKRLVGTKLGILLVQSGGDSIIAEYTWEGEDFSQTTSVSGLTLTAQQEADNWVRLAIDIQANGTNDIAFRIVPERAPAVFLGTKIWLADAQIETGTTDPSPYDRGGTGLFADREVVLETGSYLFRVTSAATGVSSEGTIDSGVGTYAVGTAIEFTLATGVAFVPQEGDVFLIFTEAERMEVMIAALQIREDLDVDVSWVQHDDTIFDGDDLDSELFVETFVPGGDDSNQDNPDHGTLLPNPPARVSAMEVGTVGPSGTAQQMLDVAWENEDGTKRDVAESRIFLSFLNETTWTQPRLAGSAPGSATSAMVPLPSSVNGQLCWVMIQPVSFGGARRAPRQSMGQVIELGAFHAAPKPPTSFAAHMEGDKIVYTWNAPATAPEGLMYEIRHGGSSPKGGWVLAQKVGETTETQLGPTTWWATAGATDVRYYLRSRNRHGVYSEVLRTIDFRARTLNDTALSSTNHWWTHISQAWHDYADGWITDSAAPTYDPVVTKLARHADGYLYFTGSNLNGNYVTANLGVDIGGTFEREERIRIECHVIATCLNPDPIGESNINADLTTRRDIEPLKNRIVNVRGGNITLEGNLQGDLPTLRVQMKLVRDDIVGGAGSAPLISTAADSGGASGWMDYKPGEYVCHGAQFRLLMTRPTSDWDVRVWEFTSRCYRLTPERHHRTPVESRLARRHGLG